VKKDLCRHGGVFQGLDKTGRVEQGSTTLRKIGTYDEVIGAAKAEHGTPKVVPGGGAAAADADWRTAGGKAHRTAAVAGQVEILVAARITDVDARIGAHGRFLAGAYSVDGNNGIKRDRPVIIGEGRQVG